MTDRTPSVPVVPVTASGSGLREKPTNDVPQADGGRGEGTVDGAQHRYSGKLLVHLAFYGMLLVALAPFMRVDTAWTIDEGLYVYQVETLQQGEWGLDYWAEPIDPDRRWFALQNVERGANAYFPYVKSPTYPLLLLASSRVLGDAIGLHLLPILGALGAAAGAWLLALLIDRRAAPFAFWITALGPVVVNAYVIWAHALSAAVAGLTAYAVIRALRDGLTPIRVAAVCLGAASGVLLRTEGLLFAASVALVLGAIGAIRLVTRTPDAIRALCISGAVGTSALAVNAIENRWVSSVMGRFSTNDFVRGDALPYWRGKLQGVRHVLVDGSYYEKDWLFDTAVLVAMLATLIAGIMLRRPSVRAQAAGTVAVFVAVAALVLRFAGLPQDTVPGIIPAWLIAILGLLLFKGREAARVERVLIGVVVLEVLATLATQYNFGGGKEWGARYLSPLYPLIAVLAAVALYRAVQRVSPDARRRLVQALALLTLIPAVAGLGALRGFRAIVDERVQLVENGRGVVITSEPSFAQRAFRTYPRHEWLRVQRDEIPEALKRLGEAGHKDVIVFEPLSTWSTEPSSLPGGYRVERDLGRVVYLTQP